MQAAGGASLSGDGSQTDEGASPNDGEPVGAPRRPGLVGIVLAVASVVVILDQLTKAIAMDRLADGHVVDVIDGWLQLRLVYNPGAAFGMATGYTIVLTAIAAAVVIVILRISRRLAHPAWAVALGLLLGGASGNLIDRIFREPAPFRGHVIDWIQLPYWPVFNIADSMIVSAAVLMVLLSLRGVEYDRVGGR